MFLFNTGLRGDALRCMVIRTRCLQSTYFPPSIRLLYSAVADQLRIADVRRYSEAIEPLVGVVADSSYGTA